MVWMVGMVKIHPLIPSYGPFNHANRANYATMSIIFYLVQKEFLQIFRNRLMLPLMLVMPVFQMLLLSFAANFEVRNLALGVVDHDLSPASRQLVSKFTASGYFRIRDVSFSAKQAEAALIADRTDLTLEIPPHFERDLVREGRASLSLTANAINAVKGGLALAYAGTIVRDFNGEMLEKWQPRLAALESPSDDLSSLEQDWSAANRPPFTVYPLPFR